MSNELSPSGAADCAVRKIEAAERSATTNVSSTAYQALLKEYQDYASKHSAADTRQYMQEMTAQLTKDGLLPAMAAVWASENSSKLAGDDGAITLRDLRQNQQIFMLQQTEAYFQNTKEAFLNDAMTNQLLQSYDKLKSNVGGVPFFHFLGHQGIKQIDLETTIANLDKQAAARADAKVLVANKNHLFNLLAKESGGDGKTITREGAEKLLQFDQECRKHDTLSPLSADEVKAVKNIIDRWKEAPSVLRDFGSSISTGAKIGHYVLGAPGAVLGGVIGAAIQAPISLIKGEWNLLGRAASAIYRYFEGGPEKDQETSVSKMQTADKTGITLESLASAAGFTGPDKVAALQAEANKPEPSSTTSGVEKTPKTDATPGAPDKKTPELKDVKAAESEPQSEGIFKKALAKTNEKAMDITIAPDAQPLEDIILGTNSNLSIDSILTGFSY